MRFIVSGSMTGAAASANTTGQLCTHGIGFSDSLTFWLMLISKLAAAGLARVSDHIAVILNGDPGEGICGPCIRLPACVPELSTLRAAGADLRRHGFLLWWSRGTESNRQSAEKQTHHALLHLAPAVCASACAFTLKHDALPGQVYLPPPIGNGRRHA